MDTSRPLQSPLVASGCAPGPRTRPRNSPARPEPGGPHRKPDAGMRKIVKAYALLCLEVLCQSGWSVTDASKIIAETLRENDFPVGGRIESPGWKSVKGWRDRLTKLAANDQTRETLEGL